MLIVCTVCGCLLLMLFVFRFVFTNSYRKLPNAQLHNMLLTNAFLALWKLNNLPQDLTKLKLYLLEAKTPSDHRNTTHHNKLTSEVFFFICLCLADKLICLAIISDNNYCLEQKVLIICRRLVLQVMERTMRLALH